jgi:arginyl-tRNA--protein-N-Asp/Glu arginylyltransferase
MMFAEKHYPEQIHPEELDAYLAQGWYRMGQTIFTTHFLCFGEQFYSALWIRLHLEGYEFRKRLRKLLQRNDKLFRVEYRRTDLRDRETELLYQRYKAHFPGHLASTLCDSLLDGEDHSIFNTLEVAVYDGERLVAASFFDLGADSVASIMGIYDPAYQRYSLGFYTMLKEITFARDNGFRYYYPGYVVPGYERFDYKLRIGDVRFLDLAANDWRPYKNIGLEDIPLRRMERRLSDLKNMLHNGRAHAKQHYYPLFEANLFGLWRTNFFDYPVFLNCNGVRTVAREYLIVVYDIRLECYLLCRCIPFDDIQFFFNDVYTSTFNQDKFFMELIVIDQVLERSREPEHILRKLSRLAGSSLRH